MIFLFLSLFCDLLAPVFPHSFPNALVQTFLVARYFSKIIYFVMDYPMIGCITGAQKCSNGVGKAEK